MWNSISRESAYTSVGNGWKNLITIAYDNLPLNTHVNTVKEKYGGLRIYVDSAPEQYLDMLDELEHLSWSICEYCGKAGKSRTDRGWIKTMCDDCYNNEKKE